jgi:hypothetical protein
MAKLTAALVTEKLREFHGNFSAVARCLCVGRTAVGNFVRRRPQLQEVAKECRETMKDHAESALYRAIFNGEAWAVCFYLKTQDRDRGYIEKTVLEGGENPLQVRLVRDPDFYGNADRLRAIDN